MSVSVVAGPKKRKRTEAFASEALDLSEKDKAYFKLVKELFPLTTPFYPDGGDLYILRKVLSLGFQELPFARKDIRKGMIIAEIEGEAKIETDSIDQVVTRGEVPLFSFSSLSSAAKDISLTLVAKKIEGVAAKILHAEESYANVAFQVHRSGDSKFRVVLVAVKAIKEGEALLRNWGVSYPQSLHLGWPYLMPSAYKLDLKTGEVSAPSIGIPEEQRFFIENIARTDMDKGLALLAGYGLAEIAVDTALRERYEKLAKTFQSLEGHSMKKGLYYDRRHLGDFLNFFKESTIKIPYFLTLSDLKSLGWGLFANQPIVSGTLIGVYTGELFGVETLDDKVDMSYFFQLSEDLVVDATAKGNYTRFINHSEEGNLKVVYMSYKDGVGNLQASICFYSTQKIEKGEQLLFDYGKAYKWHLDDDKKPTKINPRSIRIDPETGEVIDASIQKRACKPLTFVEDVSLSEEDID